MSKFRIKLEKVEDSNLPAGRQARRPQITKEEWEAKHEALKKQKAEIVWKSASRPYKKRHPQYFITSALAAIFFILFAILIGEYVAIGVVLAALFVTYVLAIIEPEDIDHKIVKDGIVSGSHSYLWEELASFWFEKRYGKEVLVLETNMRFPARVIIVLGEMKDSAISKTLSKKLQFREAPILSWLDKFTDDLAQKLPFEPKT